MSDTEPHSRLRDAAELSAIGRDRSALRLLRGLVAERPRDPAVRCELAAALLRSGATRQALAEAEAAAALDGGADRQRMAHHVRGAALLRLGRPGEASQALKVATQGTSPAASLLSELAAAECAGDDPSSALGHADEAAAREPRNPAAHTMRAACLLALERWGEAEKAARRALELQPGDPQASNNLALALAAQGQLTEARSFVRMARTHSEVMPGAHDVVVRNQRVLGGGDDHRGGLRTAALNTQLRGVLFLLLFPVYGFVRSPWVLPVLVIAGAALLRGMVFHGLGGGRLRQARLVALPATARVSIPAPKRT